MGEMAYDNAAPAGTEDPSHMPEVQREITMIRGALTGVEHRWEELMVKVAPIRMARPELIDPHSPGPDSLGVYSPIGKQLREIYEEVGRMENRIAVLCGELAL